MDHKELHFHFRAKQELFKGVEAVVSYQIANLGNESIDTFPFLQQLSSEKKLGAKMAIDVFEKMQTLASDCRKTALFLFYGLIEQIQLLIKLGICPFKIEKTIDEITQKVLDELKNITLKENHLHNLISKDDRYASILYSLFDTPYVKKIYLISSKNTQIEKVQAFEMIAPDVKDRKTLYNPLILFTKAPLLNPFVLSEFLQRAKKSNCPAVIITPKLCQDAKATVRINQILETTNCIVIEVPNQELEKNFLHLIHFFEKNTAHRTEDFFEANPMILHTDNRQVVFIEKNEKIARNASVLFLDEQENKIASLQKQIKKIQEGFELGFVPSGTFFIQAVKKLTKQNKRKKPILQAFEKPFSILSEFINIEKNELELKLIEQNLCFNLKNFHFETFNQCVLFEPALSLEKAIIEAKKAAKNFLFTDVLITPHNEDM